MLRPQELRLPQLTLSLSVELGSDPIEIAGVGSLKSKYLQCNGKS